MINYHVIIIITDICKQSLTPRIPPQRGTGLFCRSVCWCADDVIVSCTLRDVVCWDNFFGYCDVIRFLLGVVFPDVT